MQLKQKFCQVCNQDHGAHQLATNHNLPLQKAAQGWIWLLVNDLILLIFNNIKIFLDYQPKSRLSGKNPQLMGINCLNKSHYFESKGLILESEKGTNFCKQLKKGHFKGLFFLKHVFTFGIKKMRTAGLKMAFWRVLTITKGKTKTKQVVQAQPWPAKLSCKAKVIKAKMN